MIIGNLSVRLLVALTFFCALCLGVAVASEFPPVVPAEDIAERLTLDPGKRKKIEFEASSDGMGSYQPTQPEAPLSRRIVLPAIQFEFDSDRLIPPARKQVTELAKALTLDELRPHIIAVQGHTDSVGNRNYNRALSLSAHAP